jgi:uncharacterized protein (DUF488 family)
LVDVRERAQSRRPGFSKKSLEAALQQVGIEYVHLPQLGDPKEGRDAARAGNVARFREIYHEAISTPLAKEALGRLERLASEKTICLMCFERDQRDCHRKIIADKLEKALKIRASHLCVMVGAADASGDRRVLHSDQGAAASVQ